MNLDLKRLFPNFEPVTSSIADCLRFWAQEQPEETAKAISEFLRSDKFGGITSPASASGELIGGLESDTVKIVGGITGALAAAAAAATLGGAEAIFGQIF